MVTAFLLVAMTAAPATEFRAAAPGLTVIGMDPSKAGFYTEHVAHELSAAGVRVTTPKEISALLGLERQKQLMGCSDGGESCMAELANALGADGVLLGDVAKLEGGSYQVSLKMTWSRDGRPLTSFVGRAYSEEALLGAMTLGAQKMAADLKGDWVRLASAAETHQWEQSHPLQTYSWIPIGVGVVAAGLGTFALVSSNRTANRLANETFVSRGEAEAIASDGKSMQTLGMVGVSVGVTAIVAGVAMRVMGGKQLQAQAFVAPGQAGVGFAGVWE